MTLTRTELQAANAAENPHAGKGQAVVLDIGGDIGALVVTMPAAMADLRSRSFRPGRGNATRPTRWRTGMATLARTPELGQSGGDGLPTTAILWRHFNDRKSPNWSRLAPPSLAAARYR